VKWMEQRVHGDMDAIETPCGYMPKYEDLKKLFRDVLGKEYTAEQYEEQFMLRIPERLAKKERILKIYHTKVFDTPHVFLQEMEAQKKRVEECRAKHGDYVSPFVFAGGK